MRGRSMRDERTGLGGALRLVRCLPVRSRTPQSRLLCYIGDLLLLLSRDHMTGGPASTSPNSPVSNALFDFIVLPVQMGIFCRVKQWSCELPGSSACFSTSVSFCLSAASIFKFSCSSGPPESPPRHSPLPLPYLPNCCHCVNLCSQGATRKKSSFVFSS